MNWDINAAKQGTIKFDTFPIYTDIYYRGLRTDPFLIDIEKAALNYTHMVVDNDPVVYAQIPLIKHWSVGFHYLYKMLWWHEGDMKIEFNNMNAIATAGLKATTDGHIFPYLHDVQVHIDESKLYHTSFWAQFWYRQIFDLVKCII